MTFTLADLPTRQLTRLRSEIGMAASELTTGMFPDQRLLGIEFGIVARVSLPDWISPDGLGLPTVTTRTITARQIALSLGRPPESVRRHLNLLRDRGILTSSATGLSLAPAAAPVLLVYYWKVHDLLLRLIEDMAATCDIALKVNPTRNFGPGDVIERALDILLLPIDTYRPVGKSPIAFLIWAALTVIAVRHITYDPVLARRYANTIPPDDLRQSITLRKLAAALVIPYATAWRQMETLHEAGLVTRTDDGEWTVLTHSLLHDSVRDIGTPPSAYVLNKVRELAALGLDPRHAADHYHSCRPALADLGTGI